MAIYDPMTLQDRNAAFRALLDGLNPAQRQAVEQTEGPVLVIAGPGTGKTQLLAARIGKILLDTDARPQNILCLTFTDAGVTAMRQRLLDMIGPEAHRVPIYTFHAFCNRVIQENLEVFGRADLTPVSELERIEIVRTLLDQLPHEHPLREGRKDVYQFEAHLRDLFLTMKKEGWTPGFVHRKIEEYLDALPADPAFIYQKDSKYGRKGEPKTVLLEAAREKMTRLRAAADLFPKYLNTMQRRGRYEYEDMILWVLRAFDRQEALLRGYQERFQYFLVDEYQDTNGAQNRLLQRLLDYWPNPNVLIVGDDDQSIYEFQGARLQNLLDFYRTHRDTLQTIVLDRNYRSPQDLLDAARRLIEHNALRAVQALDQPLSKALRAHTAAEAEPTVLVFENRLHELTDLVGRIERLLKNGVPAGEIAVLYARHRQVDRLMALLEKKDIPYATRRPVNLLELPVVGQFRELLRYLADEARQPFSGDARLFRLLHAAWWGVPPLDLARVAANLSSGGFIPAPTPSVNPTPDPSPSGEGSAPRGKQTPLPGGGGVGGGVDGGGGVKGDGGRGAAIGGNWREALQNKAFLQSLSLAAPQRLLEISAKLENWLSDASNLSLPALVERLYNQSGLLAWALAQPDKVWWLQVLNSLLDFVKAEAGRDPRLTPERLLALLESLDDNRLSLAVQQQVRGGEAVSLLTAHAAKGLEFDHVFMFDCSEEAWEPGAGARGGRFSLPDTLTLSGEEDALEARRRLFYVAATRARRRLTISYARTGADGKALRQARFVDELGLPKAEAAVAPEAVLEVQTALLLEPPKPVVTLPEPALLDELLQNFTLNITALNRFLRCPLAFYYEDVLRIPKNPGEAAAFGDATHEALRQFFLKIKNARPTQPPDEDDLLRLFKAEMERRRGFFSAQAFEQRLALGRGWLRRYFAEQIPRWTRRAIVERRIDRVELDGVPLTGVLDKIEWLDNHTIRIVDYKTGAPDPRRAAPPDEAQPLGGPFWRQLVFYKILLERAGSYPEPVGSGAVAWLEPDRRGVFPSVEIRFSAGEVQLLENLIRETYAKIQGREFTTGCGQDDCAWCRMHRDRVLPEALPRVEEELDDGGGRANFG